MANSAGSASIDIKPSLAGFVKDLKSDLERIDADFQVDVSADLTRFREQIARLDGADVTVNVDLAGVEAVAARLRFEHQGKGRIADRIDRGDGVHLDGDAKSHVLCSTR